MNKNIPHIFDTQRIVYNRSQGCMDRMMPLIEHITHDMMERLSCIKEPFQSMLEVWPLSPYLKSHITKTYTTHRYDMFGACLGDTQTDIFPHPFDGLSKLPFMAHTYDLILGQLGWHFINDFPGILHQIRHLLKPNGLMLSQIFGAHTLSELNQVIHDVMMQTWGGVRPLIAPFITPQQGGMLLQRAGLNLCVVDRTLLTLYYDNLKTLLRDIQALGAQACLVQSQGVITPGFLKACEAFYFETFGTLYKGQQSLPVTLEILTLSGWAPDEATQQKPLRPHHAPNRLQDYVGHV